MLVSLGMCCEQKDSINLQSPERSKEHEVEEGSKKNVVVA